MHIVHDSRYGVIWRIVRAGHPVAIAISLSLFIMYMYNVAGSLLYCWVSLHHLFMVGTGTVCSVCSDPSVP